MRLESLSLRQFRVFEELDLEFSDGLIGVRGANGAGKTTLAEAIGWALFGKLRGRAKVAHLRRQDAPDGARASATLTWRIGDVRYTVERVVNGSARLWIGDALETTQTTATNLRIAQELNMTWDLFCRTVYARQKDVAALDPGATGEARRAHIERLLGLGRVREAAVKAKDEHKRLRAELDGMRAALPAVEELREALDEASRRALDTPAIAAADEAAVKARAACDAAREAAAAEAVRAARHAELAPRVAGLERLVADGEHALAGARRRCEARAEAIATEARLADGAGGAPEAVAVGRSWQALAEAAEAHRTATDALEGLAFDAPADERRALELGALRVDLDALVVPDGVPALTARVTALEAVERAGALEAAAEREAAASQAVDAARRAAAGVEARLEAEREHLAVLRSDGDEASCPVCLRPFEGPREAVVAEHERRIGELERDLAAAERSHAEAVARLAAAREARDAAARAADALAATDGAPTLAEAHAALERAVTGRDEALARQRGLRARVSELEAAVRDAAQARALHAQLSAAVAARRDDIARRCDDLGVEAYDRRAHLAATEEAGRLLALQEQLVEARAVVSATEGAEAARDAAAAQLEQRRDELAAVQGDLDALAFDPGARERLAAAAREAETRWDELRAAAERLKVATAAASAEVKALQDRIAAAEQLARDIAAAEAELRAHHVAHSVLVSYRDAQTRRAWPALEQTAGALLAQATDGRYADVRFSGDDFRLVIVDRGSEHPFDRYSGGEQDLANLCVRLAIADWIARERDVELGFVVLDEVFGSQDEARRRGLIEQLRRLSERFHQMLVITHVPEIADQCDTVVVLEQPEHGRSRIAA